ncbi:VWA domain-containing protein [Rhodocytophaga rosea]|uniref:VWA domain-containing protein n=1 Tax=Rhodocytophaga rosea TaxID=2704465 RepID=A0A6C0GNL3_9BACT|nr:VWA domain-containing protein [Rhodocytophaga rosea]QHT69619.1 VWA domain-containing protein [Rhodocytophaga rosea]
MERFQLLISSSPWFILLCLVVGAVYAAVLYQKKPVWGKNLNLILAACRFVVVSLLCFLLLSPFIKQVKNSYEKPTIVLAVDNSQSVALTSDSAQLNNLLSGIRSFNQTLQDKGINVDIQFLNSATDSTSLSRNTFTGNSTNLSQMLSNIQSNYLNRNLAGVVLVSDGIYNQGSSPEYLPYNFPIYPVALGDTIPKRDLNLKTLYFNKITYLGNKFPVVAEVHSTGYAGKLAAVSLKQNGKVIEKKNVSFRGNNDVQEVNFVHTANVKGMQHYTVEIDAADGEFTAQNNIRDAYIDVIDGKEKILLLALTPHPDIKAIKSILEKNENYQLEIVIAGEATPKESKYDLLILHQIPDNYNNGLAMARKFIDSNTPVWYIVGAQTNIGQLNGSNNAVKISSRMGQVDQVTPVFNSSFNIFKYSPEQANTLQKLPPVAVPFGEYKVPASAEVLLYQRVGNLVTNKPLLVVHTDKTRKSATLMGDGLWEWRLEEFNLTEKHDAVDDLVSKLVQYLSAKEDKRKLRVYPIADEFLDSEKVIFEAETYNDIYERIYGIPITLELTDDENQTNKYTFTNSEDNPRFEISGLTKGIYRYKASAQVQGKAEQVTGEFTVKDLQLEALNTTADHTLLKKLAEQTNGRFYLPTQFNDLAASLSANPPPDIIQSSEELLELIHLKWLFFLFMTLLTIEWGIRKYQGAY